MTTTPTVTQTEYVAALATPKYPFLFSFTFIL